MKGTGIMQGVDILDTLIFIAKKNKRFQASFLRDLEGILNPRSTEYKTIRKLYLDSQNTFTRAILRDIFGDIEDLIN